MAHPAGDQGTKVPVHPTKIPSSLQVESQVVVVQYLYDHHKHGSYIGTHQFPPSRCKLFNYYRLSTDNVHSNLISTVNQLRRSTRV